MAAVKSKDTSPELAVRKIVHALGYRYRLHVRALPGTPDLVFPRLKKSSMSVGASGICTLVGDAEFRPPGGGIGSPSWLEMQPGRSAIDELCGGPGGKC